MRRFSTSFLQGNIARELGEFGVAFYNGTLGEGPTRQVLKKTTLFNTDAMICGLSALHHRANAPVVLRKEALSYPDKKGAVIFAGKQKVKIEKAVLAASAAVREWDANGTNFGYYAKDKARQAGEFGHNDFYPVCIGAAHVNSNLTGKDVLKAMVLLDEVRGRLAEVFSLKTYAIDHVLHGGIGSVVSYGVLLGLTPQEIESALGILIGHYIPYRATRQGHLSDSKGSAAAFMAEAAINSVHRASLGFVGPSDIFNNPKAIFMTATGIKEKCPFQLTLTHSGKDFAINQMHFKLGIYEHQSAGAIHSLLQLINQNPQMLKEEIKGIDIFLYEPAYSIIADPSKKVPKTRQTADHSMYFIIAQLLNKCINNAQQINQAQKFEQLWAQNMLCPEDYDDKQLLNQDVLNLIQKINVQQGGPEFDKDYPKGIPTRLSVKTSNRVYESEYCLFPAGHALNKEHDLEYLLKAKWYNFAQSIFNSDQVFEDYIKSLSRLGSMSNRKLKKIYEVQIDGL